METSPGTLITAAAPSTEIERLETIRRRKINTTLLYYISEAINFPLTINSCLLVRQTQKKLTGTKNVFVNLLFLEFLEFFVHF